MRYKIIVVLALLAGVAVIIGAQFCMPAIIGADGYLHIRMSQFDRLYGVHYKFHWARFSTFTAHFADKDFLYHILLIPFTLLPDIFFGAKLAACLFVILLFLLFFWVLRKYALRPLVPVFLALFFLSANFLRGIAEPRPMVLVLALTLLFVHFLVGKKQWGLFLVTVAYTLTHVSGPYLLFFALLAEAVRLASEGEFSGKSLRAVGAGLLLGILLHPNFPNNLIVFFLNGIIVPIYALKWGLELGAEFFPIDTREYVLNYPVVFFGLLAILVLSTSVGNKVKFSTKIWLAISGFFFIFSFFSRRYLIHLYPLALVTLAAYLSDWWESGPRMAWCRRYKALRYTALVLAIALFLLSGRSVYKDYLQNMAGDLQQARHFTAVAEFMHQVVPAGEVIFHTNWSDSQYLIGLNPANDYLVTFDPTYMYYWNPQKYKLYRQISFGNSNDPYSAIKNEFGARFGYAGKNYFSGLINQVKGDPRFTVMAEDGMGVVFRLR
jgi:hypothetical protein